MPQTELENLYLRQGWSVSSLAQRYKCSQGKINYWLAKYDIPKRSISDALYQKWNPSGDPFSSPTLKTRQDVFLFGLGLGLYWGEGNKSNKVSVRLGNTDPRLIKTFLQFLKKTYRVDSSRIKFGLQIFSDMKPRDALRFWQKQLQASPKQFHKVVVTPARSLGTYRNKTKHGVLTIYFNNRKLRDIICHAVEDLDGTLSSIS